MVEVQQIAEAVARRCYVNKVFLNISQDLPGSESDKTGDLRPETLLKKYLFLL